MKSIQPIVESNRKIISINRFHLDKWRASWSNFPSYTAENGQIETRMLKYFDHFIKSISVPDFSEDFMRATIRGYTYEHPVNQYNEDGFPVNIEIFISEDLRNYEYILQYWLDLKIGRAEKEGSGEEGFFEHVIKELTLNLYNNEETQIIGKLRFKTLFMRSCSGLNFIYGSSEEAVLSLGFNCREMEFERISETNETTNL